MRRISLLAIVAILIGVGAWATTTNPTPRNASAAFLVEPGEVAVNAIDLPFQELVDCSVVFPIDCSPAFRLTSPSSEPNATALRSDP